MAVTYVDRVSAVLYVEYKAGSTRVRHVAFKFNSYHICGALFSSLEIENQARLKWLDGRSTKQRENAWLKIIGYKNDRKTNLLPWQCLGAAIAGL
jgi:hypothetical protein